MGAATPATSKKRRDSAPVINVTPLVDVVLVLLIIFMVIAPSLEHGERVELPTIDQPDKVQKGKLDPVTVTVGRGGSIYLENTPTSLATLPSQLTNIHAREPDRKVVLEGDGQLDYAKVREVFAVIQNAGLSGVSLRVEKRGNGKEAPEEPN
jgi:biopolymer transport protein ExbD/biopolymer transport protein TolR